MEKKMLTVDEVAQAFAISRRTVERMIEKKEIPVRKFGRSVRIPVSFVESICEVDSDSENRLRVIS